MANVRYKDHTLLTGGISAADVFPMDENISGSNYQTRRATGQMIQDWALAGVGAAAISNDYGDLDNLPTLFDGAFASLSGKPTTLSGYGITDGVPTTRTVNGHALSADVTVTPTDLGLVIGADVQAFNADLSAIAALTPTNDDFIQRKGGVWTNRTVAQVKTDFNYAAVASSGSASDLSTGTLPDGRLSANVVLIDGSRSFTAVVAGVSPVGASDLATKGYVDGLLLGLLDDRGNFDASGNVFPSSGGSGTAGAVLKGDMWTISVAGTLGGHPVTAGDVVRALVDTPGQTDASWAISENNLGYTPLNAALNDGQIYIGNGSNIGTARTLSGDVTVSNLGVTAIGATKVTSAMLNSDVYSTAHSWGGQQTFTAPILGAPASGSLANCTGLPVASGISGFGTGIATALAVNVGSAGAPVIFNGALGTPTSGVVSTGVTLGGVTMTLGSDADGDIYYRASNVLTRLAKGTAGQVLTMNAGATAPEWAAAGGGGSPGGSDTQLQYNNASAFGGISGATTNGTNVTFGSGNLLATSPVFTTDITTPIVKSAAGSDLAVNATAPAATTGASRVGQAVSITASAAVASTDTAGAAAGGSVTIAAGAAARLTSGNAAGGNIVLTRGAGIGTGAVGQVLLAGGDGTATAPALASATNPNTGIYFNGGNQVGISGNGTSAANFGSSGVSFLVAVTGNSNVSVRDTAQYRWSSTSSGAGSADTGLARLAAGVIRTTDASTGAGSLVIGTSTVGSIGTSGVGVLAIANGTAPSSSPADEFQLYSADWNGAGTAAAHFRNEEGHIVKICSQAVASLTNNVTSGGTTDQVTDWTDLTVYATDAAAIRNAIYQLSRKLAEVVTAQRANGLFR